MYNRYIPQPDGSHRRKQMAEPSRPLPPKKEPPVPPVCEPPPPPPCPAPAPHCKEPAHHQGKRESVGIGNFFRQLLPKDLDTGDLFILLLLLLMAGDCEEDRNNALLTMALYFLM